MTLPDNLPANSETAPPANVRPIDEVIAWLTEGNRDSDIREAIRAKWPDTNPDELQLAAIEHFRQAARCEGEILIGFALEAYREVYRRMIKIGDFAGAAKAIKEIVTLLPHVQRFRTEHYNDQADDQAAGDEPPTE
jgi:hypothetical protein